MAKVSLRFARWRATHASRSSHACSLTQARRARAHLQYRTVQYVHTSYMRAWCTLARTMHARGIHTACVRTQCSRGVARAPEALHRRTTPQRPAGSHARTRMDILSPMKSVLLLLQSATERRFERFFVSQWRIVLQQCKSVYKQTNSDTVFTVLKQLALSSGRGAGCRTMGARWVLLRGLMQRAYAWCYILASVHANHVVTGSVT